MPKAMSATEPKEQKVDSTQAVDEEYEKLERFHVEGRRIVLVDKNSKSEGGFGIVRRGKLFHSAYLPAWLDSRLYGPSQLVAVKQIKVSDFNTMTRMKRAFTREMLVWSRLDAHPGVAKFLGFYADFENSKAWLLSPWEPNGNVSQFIAEHDLEVPEKLSLIYDTIDALTFLHQLEPPVCHGDIKAANVLVTAECRARLCDFGLARLHEDSGFGRLETSTGMKGSIRWCSPEILQDKPRAPTSDVYAWAWLVWEVMTGDLPYQETSADYAIMCKIFESPLPLVDGTSRLSDCLQVWDLMQRCWKVIPQDRPTAQMCKTTITYLPRCIPASAGSDHQIRRAELLENLGDLEIWKGDLVKSSAHLDEALSLYEQEADSRGIASVLRKQAVAAYRNDDDGKARDKATASLELFRTLEDPLGIADASFWLGCSILNLDSGDDEALRHLNQSLETYRAHQYDIGIAHCLERIGTFQRMNYQEEKALLTLNECLAAASRSGDRLGVGRAFRSLASTHYDLGNSVEAAAACLEAIQIAWSIGWEGGLANALCRMLDIKRQSGDVHEAEEVVRESISVTRQRGLRYGLASSIWVLGGCLMEQSKFDEATAAMEESYQMYQEMSRLNDSKNVVSDIVELKRSQGDWNGALLWIDRVIPVYRSEKDHGRLAAHLLHRAKILLELQRHDEAALNLEASIAISIENEYPWDEELEMLCALPKTVMKWERRLPLLCDMHKLQRRRPQLATASLKLPIPIHHGDLDRSISATDASNRSIPFNFLPRQSSQDIE